MKILHITPNIATGGVQTLVYEFAKYQSEQGHSVDVLSMRNTDELYFRQMDFNLAGIRVIRGKYKDTYDLRHISVIRHYIQNYDIVHVHLFPNQFYAKIAYLLCKRKNRPILVTTEHNTYNNRRKHVVLRYFDRWIYRSYDRIVCISKATEDNMEKWLASVRISQKIVTINNGVDISRYSNAVNRLPEIIKADRNAEYLVMIARMAYPKDPVTIVKALPFCKDSVEAVFIGAGPLENEILSEAKELGIESRVHILGNRTDVQELIKGCSIGILSSKWDGFGLVAVEYMAAGLPCLATDVDGLKDVVGDKDLLFSYQDYKGLANKINRLLSDNEYMREKQVYCSARSKEFSIEKTNAAYLDLYKELLAEADGKREQASEHSKI